MKLSILIPVYNRDVRPLVEALHRQCSMSGVAFEIRCLDDASHDAWHQLNVQLADLEGVFYVRSSSNLGRSMVRNRLAEAATGDRLLFLDCDVGLPDEAFIERYLTCNTEWAVVCGGVKYTDEPPADPTVFFRWYYGRKREQQTAAERRSQPWHAFKSANFLIDRQTFLQIGFDDRLIRYGHEDTLFGLELQRRNIAVEHIDNPVLHLGLEPFEVFLKKTGMAVDNLFLLRKLGKPVDTSLTKTYDRIVRWGLCKPVELLFALFRPLMLANLRSRRPILLFFDFYKLALAIKTGRRLS